MTEAETIPRKEHDAIMSNVVLYMKIDAALADAQFEAEKMGKDKDRCIKPLDTARNICQNVLLGQPVAQEKKKEESPKKDDE